MSTIHESVKVFDGVRIIGNVIIDSESSVWYNAVLRGDIESISIGKCSNVQDNCVIHSSKNYPVNLGDYVSVGHAAVLHGCEIGDNCLIGMNSTVLNGAKIGKNNIIGAGAVVTEGKEFDEGNLILGIPAKAIKKLTKKEIENIKDIAVRYTKLAHRKSDSMVKVKKIVKELDPYVPGKSIDEIANKYNINPESIIKLGSNENPAGVSPKAIEAVKKEVHLIGQYPESNLEDLKDKIADYACVDSSNIIIGGDGADEILDVLGKTLIGPGDEFIVPIPSYMYYEFTLKIQGGIPVYAKWNVEENKLDVDSVIDAISDKTKIIFLCTPNNPTGGLISKEDIKKVLESTDVLVVVDEAYFEFSDVNNVDLLVDYDNLLILRTFSKVLGLAGMRIGYAISNPEFIEYMHRVKPVFSLTKLSYVAALATLDDKEYIKKSTEISIQSREFLTENMSKFDKLHVYESKANYILVDIRKTGMTSKEFSEELLKKGFIVRDCSSFKGLDDYWIRVSVGTLEEDARFIKILESIIG